MGYLCNCGAQFPATLHGAWEAKLHAEDHEHRLIPWRPALVAA
jgi:hypothetical protein